MARTKQTARKSTQGTPYDRVEKNTTSRAKSATSPPHTVTSKTEKKAQSTTQEVHQNSTACTNPNSDTNPTAGTNLISPKSVFHTLVQETMQKQNVNMDFQPSSLDSMQAYVEDYITSVMQEAEILAEEDGRHSVERKDVARAKQFLNLR